MELFITLQVCRRGDQGHQERPGADPAGDSGRRSHGPHGGAEIARKRLESLPSPIKTLVLYSAALLC